MEKAGVKFERGGEMLGEILPIVAAGVNMGFVGNISFGENFVE